LTRGVGVDVAVAGVVGVDIDGDDDDDVVVSSLVGLPVMCAPALISALGELLITVRAANGSSLGNSTIPVVGAIIFTASTLAPATASGRGIHSSN